MWCSACSVLSTRPTPRCFHSSLSSSATCALEPSDSPADKLAKLGVALEGVAPDAKDAIHLLADLLLLPMAEPQNALELTPKMRKERDADRSGRPRRNGGGATVVA